ncbi:MAG: hypothetical protein FJ290_24535 [Planctomycetes bacterium]|nr:hypothetical protein [Planctomycetota bacterium]
MTATARHRVAALTFAGGLVAHLAAGGLSLLFDAPAVFRAVRILATVVALGAALALFLDRAVWTIARNTIAQAVRVKLAFVIMAAYLVLVLAIPFTVRGDGTLRGLLNVVINYSLIVGGLLLGILSLTLSTTSLWSEFRDRQIFLLEAKPLRRWQVLLGKLLGILLINAALLAFMGLVTWGSVHYLVARAERAAARIPAAESFKKSQAEKGLRDAREQILAARRTVLPDPPPESDLEEFIRRNLDMRARQLEHPERLPPEAKGIPDEATRRAIIRNLAAAQLAAEFRGLVNAVPPLFTRVWRFSGLTAVPRTRQATVTLRFKFFSSDRKSEEPDHVCWEFGVPNRTKWYQSRPDAAYLPDEVHELQVPADAIDQEGVLEVRFTNREPRKPTLIFSSTDSIQVLIPVGGFAGNLVRALAVIFLEVLFITILGLFCSAFLGFPVSPIVALAILLLTLLASTVKGELDKGFTFDQNLTSPVARAAEKVTRVVTTVLDAVLPPFHKFTPSALVSSGEEVSLGLVHEATWSLALVYGGLLMLLGMHIFERREIGLAVP